MAKRKNTLYAQCGFRRKNEYHQAWIPEKYAEVGRVLKFKLADGTWDDGWEVLDVGAYRTDAEEADRASQAHKKNRAASDI